MKVIIAIVKFLFLGALFIVSNENLYLNDAQDLSTFYNIYYSWLDTLFAHSMQITSFVVNSEWLPTTNQTLIDSGG